MPVMPTIPTMPTMPTMRIRCAMATMPSYSHNARIIGTARASLAYAGIAGLRGHR
jgi:hypothetical protein